MSTRPTLSTLRHRAAALAACAIVLACQASEQAPLVEPADIVLYGQHIHTVDAETAGAEVSAASSDMASLNRSSR